ncbi:hypothetical protein FS837_006776 [Tulasnella sp. UAMH 9824]|nr:hypothetical protein FS837_006776 [Tulasnella sp. UAMH 9824]
MVGPDPERCITRLTESSSLNPLSAEKQFLAQEDAFDPPTHNNSGSRFQQDSLLLTINDLPLELITQILYYSLPRKAILDRVNRCPCHLGQYLNSLRDIASVCAKWRSIIQSVPNFWALIESTITPDEMRYMISKSGKCALEFKHTLDVNAKVHPRKSFDEPNFLGLAGSNMSRCSSLMIQVQYSSQAACIIESPAPILREAAVIAHKPDINEQITLFNGQAGELESLRLDKIPIRWDLGLPPRLRRVGFFYGNAPSRSLPHPREFVSALSNCPEIEIVHYTGTYGRYRGLDLAELEVQEPMVQLLALKELGVENMSMAECSYVLGRLWAPVLRKLALRVNHSNDPVVVLLHPPRRLLLESIRRTLLQINRFEFKVGPDHAILEISGVNGHLDLRLQCPDSDELSGWLAEEFPLELLSVPELRLTVSYMDHDSEFQGLRKFLETLSNLERLHCPYVKGASGVLAEHLMLPYQASDGWRWHWPGLKRLELGDWHNWDGQALAMLRERYGSSRDHEHLTDGPLKWYPSPLTSLDLHGLRFRNLKHTETSCSSLERNLLRYEGSSSEVMKQWNQLFVEEYGDFGGES